MAERIIHPVVSEAQFAEEYRRCAVASGLSEEFLGESLTHSVYEIYARLVESSKSFNLTAITEHTAVVERHIVDSLLPAYFLHRAELMHDGDCIADIGAGAGFPTLPIAAASVSGAIPSVTLHSIDSTAKKIGYISDTAKRLGFSNVAATAGRAEELSRGKMRESFDIVTARAVSALPILLELCAPFVRVGGIFAAMKAHAKEELEAARGGAEKLGFSAAETIEYSLPSGDARTLVIYKKIKATPAAYPRSYSKIAAKPL